jgi:DNA helicase II / ATP-dependent DNA helicase PcrA
MPSRFLSEIPAALKAGTVLTSPTGRGGWGAALRRRGEFERAESDTTAFQTGERVRHAKFGVGEVVETGDGKVVVRFGTQERIFVPELAPLTRA